MLVHKKNELCIIAMKLPSLILGLFLCATGLVAMYYAGLGLNPWNVLHVGLTNYVPITIGQASQLVGLTIIISSIFLGIIPGFGTIVNMILVGFFYDLVDMLKIFSTPEVFINKVLILFLGIFLFGWGSFFYLRVQLGAGPRDGLMEGLVKKFGRPVWVVRSIIELLALTAGYFLGGPVGIGTVIIASTIGLSVQTAFKIGRYEPKESKHLNILELTKMLRDKPLDKSA